jgi:hypothetical protein
MVGMAEIIGVPDWTMRTTASQPLRGRNHLVEAV